MSFQVRKHGFRHPVLVPQSEGLGLVVPPASEFSVMDIKALVGKQFPVKAIETRAQEEREGWTMGDWARYFAHPEQRGSVLNLIFEFSGTALQRFVRSPKVVRDLDWMDTIWPADRRRRGFFPRVQLYCIMSSIGSWMDFHIDFGGSSVWYHVLRGEKHFLLVPPTTTNLTRFEVRLSGMGGSSICHSAVQTVE